jgi:uncharacterized protein (TIGR02271 family)
MSSNNRPEVVRHAEELNLATRPTAIRDVYAAKRVELENVTQDVPREVEDASVERLTPAEGDSGEIEILPDGSISIPVLEEELVVTKRTVVRERLVIRKEVVTETQRVEAELRREHFDLDLPGGGHDEAA